MLLKLNIKYADGRPYWTEHFASQDELETWLNEEILRPYWQEDFAVSIEDLTPPAPSQAELDKETQRVNNMTALKARIKTLANQDDLTAAEVKEAILKFIKFQLLQKSLD